MQQKKKEEVVKGLEGPRTLRPRHVSISSSFNIIFLSRVAEFVRNICPNIEMNPLYSVCSLVVPRLEEAILTPVLKKNFKRPLILGQEGHNYPPKHSNLSYDQFGVRLEQSDTAPALLPPGWRDTDSFSWICSVFNSSISRRS